MAKNVAAGVQVYKQLRIFSKYIPYRKFVDKRNLTIIIWAWKGQKLWGIILNSYKSIYEEKINWLHIKICMLR